MSLWIARAERIISEEIPASPDAVRNFYVDLDNIKDLHPLVVSVELRSHDRIGDGYRKTYRVQDRIALGPLSIRITYWARLDVPAHGDVITEARQFPRVRLNGIVSFEPIDSGTRLTERLTIAAPRPLAAMTQREAAKAHIAMLSGIRRHFQTGWTRG